VTALFWLIAIVAALAVAIVAWFCIGVVLKAILVWTPSAAVIAIGGALAWALGGLAGAIVALVALGFSYKVYELWSFSSALDRLTRRLDALFGTD
jgi:hypothetical protein